MRVLDRPEPSDLDAPAVAPPGRGIRYMPALDGLRALAVIAVLLFHGGVLTGGYLGVDAFFVLSGFLITSLIVSEVHSHGRLGLGAFWGRRARRLLPALLLALFGVALYAVLFARPSELSRIRGDEFATLFYVANWHAIFAGHGYWSLFQAPSPLEHAWSLAIEEQFYLIWPLLMAGLAALVVRRHRRTGSYQGLAPVVFVVAVVSAAMSAAWCMVLYDPTDTSRAYLGTDTRIAAILIGAAFAAWMAWRGPVKSHAARIALEVLATLAVIGLAVAWTRLDGQSEFLYRGGLLLCGLAVMTVVAAAAHPTRGPIAHALSWRPLVAIGLISYGLYLWHWPVYLVMNPDRMGFGGNALLATRIAASFAIAITSYFLIEKPIRHGAISRRWLAILTPIAVVACVAAILAATAGAVAPSGGPLESATQHSARVDAGNRTHGNAAAERRLLVVGDSVAGNIAFGAQRQQDQFGVQVGDATSAGCVLPGATAARTTINLRTSEIQFDPCAPTWLSGAQLLDPGNVLLVYGTAAAFTDLMIDGQWVGACDTAYQDWYQRELGFLIDQLFPDATVYLAQLPHLEGTWLPDFAGERIDCINAANRSLARKGANIENIDLAGLVCPDGECRETIGTDPFRIDGFHFSKPAADYLARILVPEIVGQLPPVTTTVPVPTTR